MQGTASSDQVQRTDVDSKLYSVAAKIFILSARFDLAAHSKLDYKWVHSIKD